MFENDMRVIAKLREECENSTSHRCAPHNGQVGEPAQPPEGALIERLRKAMQPSLSIRAAAKQAGMSGSRWTQIVRGYKQEKSDLRIAVQGPAKTVARMAHVVGATPDQLREVGRPDAAEELDKIVNWKKYVRPGFGAGSLRWRAELEQKPESEWTLEDHAFKQEEQREHSLRQRAAEAAGEEWPPPDVPASRPPKGYGLAPRSFEEIFNEWQVARARLLNLELEYAIGRNIDPDKAVDELREVLRMVEDTKDGRPWTPPWNPGAEFEEGEEPWKADFWTYTEAVPSPFGTEGHIYQHGTTYNLAEARRRRDLTAQAEEVWEGDVRRQTATYQERQGKSADDDAALTPNEAARSGVPGLQVSEVNEHSVKTETVLPDAVYEAGFNTAGETASPSEEGFFVATGGSSSAIPGLHVEWPKIDVVVDLPELPDREPVTEGLGPKIDVDVLEGWADAMDDLHAKLTSLQAVAKSESASEADPDLAVRAFLTAVDIYVFATRELVREMQAVDLYASEAQIRTGLVTFEYNIELAQLYLPTVEVIERSAPNKRLKVLPARSAEGLRALIDSLRAAHDAWIDAGLSSEHPADAMRALATAARTAPPGYRSPGRAARDAQDQVGEAGQLTGDDDGVH